MRDTVLFILLLFMFVSCEKVIDINLSDSQRSIVVNNFISCDSILTVNISKSLSILDQADILFIDNAQVRLFENDVFIMDMEYNENGFYIADSLYPKENNTYKLIIEVPNLTMVETKTQIPEKNYILNIDTSSFISGGEYQEEKMKCKIKISDIPHQSNYYMIQAYRIENYDPYYLENFRNYLWFESTDPVLRDSVPAFKGAFIFKDDLFDGQVYEISVNFSKWNLYSIDQDSVDIYFCLSSVTQDYYYYMKSYYLYQGAHGNPFAEPVQVYTNVQNGMGIFAGYSATEYKLTVPVYTGNDIILYEE